MTQKPPPTPFRIEIAETVLADLRDRLARTRFPDQAPGAPWSYGADLAYVRELVAYWRERYDWRKHEALLNGFRQFTAPVAGIDLHFIHEEGRGPKPLPLLLSHGWPGSVWEFHKIIWVTGAINSSFWPYYARYHAPWPIGDGQRVEVPTAYAAFPKEIVRPPRSWAERVYNIRRWTVMPSGGHFAALEEPQALVDDLRAFFRDLR